MSTVTIKLRTLSGELLQMSVKPDDTVKTIVQKLVLSEAQMFKCPNFVKIVRFCDVCDTFTTFIYNYNEDNCSECSSESKEWKENEIASVFYDFEPKSYSIHDNGGTPFIVEVGNEIISVYAAEADDENDEKGDVTASKGELLYETSYEKVWIGDNELNDHHYTEKNFYPGNSILVHLSDITYLYIGSEIYKFNVEDGDQIKMYFSPVGNSDVPYPYAIGEKMAYFMLDQHAVPVEMIDINKDGYKQFYAEFLDNNKEDKLIDFKEVDCIQERTF